MSAAVSSRVGGPLESLTDAYGGLEAIRAELTSRLNLGGEILEGLPGRGGAGGLRLP